MLLISRYMVVMSVVVLLVLVDDGLEVEVRKEGKTRFEVERLCVCFHSVFAGAATSLHDLPAPRTYIVPQHGQTRT